MDHLVVSQERVPVGMVPLYGERYQDAWFILGRAPECQVVLPGVKVSKQHAFIQRAYGGYWLCDLGSTNGTALNGGRLAPQNPVQLFDGDVIDVGSFLLQARLPGLARPAPAAQALVQAQAGWSEAHARARTIAGDRERADSGAAPPTPYDNDVLSVSQNGVVVQNYALKKERVTIGRMALCDLKLQDAALPPEKACIERRQGRYILTNVGQDGPILVNGRDAVPPFGQRPLAHHEWFYLGQTAIQCYFLSQLQQAQAGAGGDGSGGGYADHTVRVDLAQLEGRLAGRGGADQGGAAAAYGGPHGGAAGGGYAAALAVDPSERPSGLTAPLQAAALEEDDGEDDDDSVVLADTEGGSGWIWAGLAVAALVAAAVGVYLAVAQTPHAP